MKTDNLIIIAAAAAAIWLIAGTRKQVVAGSTRPWPATGLGLGSGTAASLNNGGSPPVTEITNSALPGGEGWGWRYYSDGTAISPTGDYYYQGTLVYSQAPGNMGLGF